MKNFKNLFRWAKKYFGLIVIILFLSYALQFALSYFSLLFSYAFKVLEGKNANTVNLPKIFLNFFAGIDGKLQIVIAVGVAIVIVQVFRSVFRYINNFLQFFLQESLLREMKLKMYNHIISLPFFSEKKIERGDLIQRCTSDIEMASHFLTYEFINFFTIISTVCVGIYQIGAINVWLLLAEVITLPILAITSLIFYSHVRKTFGGVEKLEAKMTTIISENIDSSRVVRAFSNEEYEFEKMDKTAVAFRDASEKLVSSYAVFWSISKSLIGFQYAILMIVSIFLVKRNLIDSGDVIASCSLTGMIFYPLGQLGNIITNYGRATVAANRLKEVLDTPDDFSKDGKLKPEIHGAIDFKNVSLKISGADRKILSDVSFSIKPGETVAIMGTSGSGKTMICNLLTRLFEATEGSILIDGVNILDIEKKYLRKKIQVVLQEPFLYSQTIAENISITNNDCSFDEIEKVARLTKIDSEIESFTNKYDTLVGEKGATLSGGQKQRIAIARSLLSKSSVLIFDDSFSALDNKTDFEIRDELKQHNPEMTKIIITHRTTTAQNADKIIILNDGKVVDIGTHDELKVKKGLYKELWDIQGKLEDELLKNGVC